MTSKDHDETTAEPVPATEPAPEQAAAAPGAPAPSGPDAAAVPDDAPRYRVADVVDPALVRRAPRYGRFVLLGVVVGALISFVLTFLPAPGALSRSDLFWLFFLTLGLLGALGGALVALVLDRRSLRRREAPSRKAPEQPQP